MADPATVGERNLSGESTPQDLALVNEKPLPLPGVHIVVTDVFKDHFVRAILFGQVPVDDSVIPHQVSKVIEVHLLPHVIGEI